jgi:hypothetical protein
MPTTPDEAPPRLALGQGHYRTAIASGTEPRAAVLGPEALYGQEHAPELFYGDFWASHTGESGGAALTIHQAFQHFPVGLDAAPDRLRAALAGRYRVELAAEPPLGFTVNVGNGGLAIVSEDGTVSEDGAPLATIRTDPSAFALVTTNRRPLDRFEQAGRWQVAGDAALARRFAEAFKGF